MSDPHRRISLVDVLPSSARRPKRIDPYIARGDENIRFGICLGENRYRTGRGMDSALGLSQWNPLNAMSTRLKLEP